eukprot:scaffold23137_cov66-Phaeocystis_antarctica.AAC.10
MPQGALVCGIGESEGARGVVPAGLPEDVQEHKREERGVVHLQEQRHTRRNQVSKQSQAAIRLCSTAASQSCGAPPVLQCGMREAREEPYRATAGTHGVRPRGAALHETREDEVDERRFRCSPEQANAVVARLRVCDPSRNMPEHHPQCEQWPKAINGRRAWSRWMKLRMLLQGRGFIDER